MLQSNIYATREGTYSITNSIIIENHIKCTVQLTGKVNDTQVFPARGPHILHTYEWLPACGCFEGYIRVARRLRAPR